jgi:hypothetical protein
MSFVDGPFGIQFTIEKISLDKDSPFILRRPIKLNEISTFYLKLLKSLEIPSFFGGLLRIYELYHRCMRYE